MKHIVCDTSYLLHLLNVDGRSEEAKRDRILRKFGDEAKLGSIFYVPVPVIFELSNFVSQVGIGSSRRRLASAVRDAVEGSLARSIPWTIAPFEGDDSMRDWVDVLRAAVSEFDEEFAIQQIGLTDIAVVRCALKLSDVVSHNPDPRPLVHIWTCDSDLKAREPDTEVDAYL